MPQEFHVLQCYKCDTFQVHQVKKSTKWNCKLCGEKQSTKKCFGQGSGYDCRQHVQKLNLLRAEQNNREPVEDKSRNEEQNYNKETLKNCYKNEQEEITDIVINERETKKWSKYLDEADDKGDNSDDSETVEDEMYTTDQRKYDSFHKQTRRSKKRKRQQDLDREYNEDNDPPKSKSQNNTSFKSIIDPCNQVPSGPCHQTLTNNDEFIGNKVKDINQKDNTITGSVHSSVTTCCRHTDSNDTLQFENVNNRQSNNSLLKGSNGDKAEEEKILAKDKYEMKSKLSYQSSLPEGSKWGQFVEVNDESSTEESDIEQDILLEKINPSEEPYPIISLINGKQNLRHFNNFVGGSEFYMEQGENSKIDNKLRTVEPCDKNVKSHDHNTSSRQIEGDQSSVYNLSYKGSISFQTDSTANFQTEPAEMTNKTMAANSRENSSVLSVNDKKPLFKIAELNDDDLDVDF